MLPPRMDPVEVEYFEQLMKNKRPDTKMVEWGSGGSTTMFLPYFTSGTFISVEHNGEWFDKVSKDIGESNYPQAALDNFLYCLIPPSFEGQPIDLRFYGYGVPFEENGCFASRYINPETGGTRIWDADIYFIDGICRGPILATLFAKAEKRDADVYIHDFYGPERRESWYVWASSLFSKVEQIGTTLARLTI